MPLIIDSLRNGETELVNTNKLVRFYDGCDGGKTGFTKKARRTLVTSATKDGLNLIASDSDLTIKSFIPKENIILNKYIKKDKIYNKRNSVTRRGNYFKKNFTKRFFHTT